MAYRTNASKKGKRLASAGEVALFISDQSDTTVTLVRGKMTHCVAISEANKGDWLFLFELMLEKSLSASHVESAAKALKEVDIPAHFHHWLDPLKWKKQAAIDAATNADSDTHKRLVRSRFLTSR